MSMATLSISNMSTEVTIDTTSPLPPATGPWNPPGQTKWTEVEHLPEWDEEYYLVYTAKKHGKWVMLKTLRPELRDISEYKAMIENEFDVRYNLAHPAIIMINDFEDVPGLGRCIITDDVYGKSLKKLIDEGGVRRRHVDRIATQLVSAIDYIQSNHLVHHPIRPERVIFTENVENLKLIDVGFDQREQLPPADISVDINNYGKVLLDAIDACTEPVPPRLRSVAMRCLDSKKRFRSAEALRMSLENRQTHRWLMAVAIFLLAMIALLLWLNSGARPEPIA